jgi:hypothetical protein
LTDSKLGELSSYHFENTKPATALKLASRYIAEAAPKLGWVLVLRMTIEMIEYILAYRQDELAGLEDQFRAAIEDIDEKIEEIIMHGFDESEQPGQPVPGPEDYLTPGESRIGVCIDWTGSGSGIGKVQWEDEHGAITVKVKKHMLFFPKGRIPANRRRRLFYGENVLITMLTRQQIADKYFEGNVEGGDPRDVLVEVTLPDAEQYIVTNEKIQQLLEQNWLDPKEESELTQLVMHAETLHEQIPPQRRQALRFKNWHAGIQFAALNKLGMTRAIRRTLALTSQTSYEKLWSRVRFYQGAKGEHLNFGKRMELRHLRKLAFQKLNAQNPGDILQQKLVEMTDFINRLLEPFE